MNEDRTTTERNESGDHPAKDEWVAPKLTELNIEQTEGGTYWAMETLSMYT